MRRLAVFYATLAAGIAAVIALNVFVSCRESRIVSGFLGDRSGAAVIVNFEHAQRDLTMSVLRADDSAEIFALGSSHCYLIDEKFFGAPFLNLSVTSGSVMDFAVFASILAKRSPRPRLVVIGSDYWALCPQMFRSDAYSFGYLNEYLSFKGVGANDYFRAASLLSGQATREMRSAFAYDFLQRRLSAPPFLADAAYFGSCGLSDIGYDARRRIYKNPKIYDATDEFRKNAAAAHFETVRGEFSKKTAGGDEALETFGSVISALRSCGTRVVVFAPPFSFDEFALYKSDPMIYGRVVRLYASLGAACAAGGAVWLDLSDPAACGAGLAPNDFFDAHHLTRRGTAKIMRRIMETADRETASIFDRGGIERAAGGL